MIELLLIWLKEYGNVLRNSFKISLLLNSVIYVTFYTCSNQNVIYHYHVLFYKFLKGLYSKLSCFNGFYTFFNLYMAVKFICVFKIFEYNLFTLLA